MIFFQNFVVRGSSQANTMAVSVRLPPDTGPYIEHYLIQSDNGILSLESSRFKFDSIPALIAHYAQCCDELPVQLMLPRALREAKNRQQLSSLALLGQEFWRYPMASPKPGSQASTPVDPKSAATDSSGVGVTVFSSSVSQKHPPKPLKGPNILSPGQAGSPHCQVETPSDTSSSLSSFTPSNGHQLLSPESIDSVVLTMSPVESCRSGIVGKTSTFKTQLKRQAPVPLARTPELIDQGDKVGVFGGESFLGGQIRAPRPTPPNTLNLGPLRTPPAPPPRWSKPIANVSPDQATVETQANNFTVTTTVTFSMESGSKAQSPQIVEVSSPTASVSLSLDMTQILNELIFFFIAGRPPVPDHLEETVSRRGMPQEWGSIVNTGLQEVDQQSQQRHITGQSKGSVAESSRDTQWPENSSE